MRLIKPLLLRLASFFDNKMNFWLTGSKTFLRVRLKELTIILKIWRGGLKPTSCSMNQRRPHLPFNNSSRSKKFNSSQKTLVCQRNNYLMASKSISKEWSNLLISNTKRKLLKPKEGFLSAKKSWTRLSLQDRGSLWKKVSNSKSESKRKLTQKQILPKSERNKKSSLIKRVNQSDSIWWTTWSQFWQMASSRCAEHSQKIQQMLWLSIFSKGL